MANFPSSIPAPSFDSYGHQREPAWVRTDFETGPARVRRRYTAPWTRIAVGWMMDAAMLQAFQDFYITTTNEGVDWFTMTLDLGYGMTAYTVRFASVPAINALDVGIWRVGAELERRP